MSGGDFARTLRIAFGLMFVAVSNTLASIFIVWWFGFEQQTTWQTYQVFGLASFFLIIVLIVFEGLKVQKASKYFFLFAVAYILIVAVLEFGIGHRLCFFGRPCGYRSSMDAFILGVTLAIALGYCAIVGRIKNLSN